MGLIPVSWLQLTKNRLRLVAALAGITFAVVLMLMQLGLLAAFGNAGVLHYSQLRADLVLISPQYEYIIASKNFSERRLYQALAIEGVDSVSPFYMGLASWKNPETHEEMFILLFGVNPSEDVLTTPGIRNNRSVIKMPDVVLFDALSHKKLGAVSGLFANKAPVFTEINNRKVRVGGTFNLGLGFAAVGTAVTSDQNFLEMMPQRTPGMIDIGLIRLKPGADPDKVRARLAAFLPEDVTVLTREGLFAREQQFWNTVSPIGFIFGLGAAMGFVVGAVIVYQILYSDVSDHLSEYATLKAMGFSDAYLFGVVFKESLLLALLGYLPGIAISQALYVISSRATGLSIFMTPERVALVFVFTVLMCTGSGIFAMGKLRSADPAEIF
jgi:putative ABC transport system permease protein